jgi:hypothetical protein
MNMQDSDITLSVVDTYKEVSFEDVTTAFAEAEVSAEVALREREGAFAFLEWLIPAGVMLVYSTSFIQKLGSLHAEKFNAAVSKGLRALWSKAFGPKPSVNWQIIDASGRIKGEPFSASAKAEAELRDGRKVLMLFKSDISDDDFVRANHAFLSALAAHLKGNGQDPLSRGLALIPEDHVPPPYIAVVYFNEKTRALEAVDYVGSSMRRKLVTYPIPSEPPADGTIGTGGPGPASA